MVTCNHKLHWLHVKLRPLSTTMASVNTMEVLLGRYMLILVIVITEIPTLPTDFLKELKSMILSHFGASHDSIYSTSNACRKFSRHRVTVK